MPVFLSATMHCCENHVSDFLVIASVGPDRLLLGPPSCLFSRMNMCSFLTFSSQGKCSSPWPSWWLSSKLVPLYQCLVLWEQLDTAFRYGVKMLSRGNNHSPWATSYGPVQMVQDRAGLLCCKAHCGLMLSSMSANTSRPSRKAAPQSVSLQGGLPSHVWDSTSVLAKFHQVTVARSFRLYRSLWMAALTSSLLTVSSSLVLSANLASLFLFIQYSFFWVHSQKDCLLHGIARGAWLMELRGSSSQKPQSSVKSRMTVFVEELITHSYGRAVLGFSS